ncbi:AAA family ATPase [Companilactobacillus sp.]|uniref:ATP-binding protein n=1 Tax=Companilactobacillus sp. TaxID=2767905 RepID=UPI0026139A85|nr:AAA family ATPase [Companilactobacillus sp.]
MKLIKVKIYGFGKWVNQEFSIDPDYQIVFGHNEAGKTTFLNFIKSILFGFATARGANKYQQYKPKNANAYGGELTFQDDQGIEWLVKRVGGKAEGELSLFRDSQLVPNALLDKITAGFSKDDFESTHVIDEQNIRSIYDLDSQTLETQILSLGAAGSRQWLQTAEELNSDSEEVYKPRGSKQPLAKSIKRYQQLQLEKNNFEDQQTQYREITQKLSVLKNSLEDSNKDLSDLRTKQTRMHELVDKLPKYRQYQGLNRDFVQSDQSISDTDWDDFLKLDQQIKTLQISQKQQSENQISQAEKQMLDNYYSNQADIDYLNNRRIDLQNNVFDNRQLQQRLRKSDFETDQLMEQHSNLTDQMTLLSDEELKLIGKQSKSTVNLPIVSAGLISLILILFLPMTFKIIFGIIFLLAIGYGVYQYKLVNDNNQKIARVTNEILEKHHFAGKSIEEVQQLQPLIMQLNQQKQEQFELDKKLSESDKELNKWKNLLYQIGILDQNLSQPDFIPVIDQYFQHLNEVKTKQEMLDQDQVNRAQHLQSNELNLTDLQHRMQTLLGNYSVSSASEFEQKYELQRSQQQQIQQFDSIKEYLGNDLETFEKMPDADQLTDKSHEIDQSVESVTSQQNELLTKKGYLESSLKQVFNDQAYQRVIDELTQVKAELVNQYDEWIADKLASNWIKSMLNLASQNRYPKMIKRAVGFFTTLTNGNYIDINMNNTNTLSLMRKDKTIFDVHELSKATTVQLYIALRLAFVIEISDVVDLPILIDDAFVDFDQERSDTVYKLIRDVSKDNQVIFVTANLDPKLSQEHVLSFEGDKNNG